MLEDTPKGPKHPPIYRADLPRPKGKLLLLGGSWGLSKLVNNGDNWGFLYGL